jgi:hypothetical protein
LTQSSFADYAAGKRLGSEEVGGFVVLACALKGEVVAAAQKRDWGATPCAQRRPAGQWRCFTDVAGCNDTCAGAFAVDELKLWNYANADFSA